MERFLKKRLFRIFAAGLIALFIGLFVGEASATYHVKKIWQRTSATAGETLTTVGQIVCIADADGYAYTADADVSTGRPAVGVIGHGAASGSKVEIITKGIFSGWSGLAEGAPVYLSTTAGTATQSIQEPQYMQQVGAAISTTDILFDFQPAETETVSAKTASYTLTAADQGIVLTTDGAAAELTFTVLDADAGFYFTVCNAESYTVNVDPQSGDQVIGETNAAGDRIQSTTKGDTITLEAISGTEWVSRDGFGTWADAN